VPESGREVADTLAEPIMAGLFSSHLAARPKPDDEEQGYEGPAA
jgi:hypothetical protein